MNCRDFLTEFEDRNAFLSDAATRHLQDCTDCRKINVVQTRVWQLIDKFEPVAAPNDFNFHVKSKIAQAQPSDYKTAGFPALRYVLGLSVVGLLVAFVIFNGFYSLNDKNVPAIAETSIQPQKPNAITPPTASTPEQLAQNDITEETQTPAVEISKPADAAVKGAKQFSRAAKDIQLVAVHTVKRPLNKNNRDDQPFVGSRDNTLLISSKSVLPKGFENLAPADKNSPNTEGSVAITAEQILSQLGIESVLENGRRKVKKIASNSVAERSSVKVGDVIEAIDGETLTSEPIRGKTIEGKTLTIIRGTEKQEITLHN